MHLVYKETKGLTRGNPTNILIAPMTH